MKDFNNEEVSVFKKLIARMHSPKITQKIIGLTLTFSMMFTGLTACEQPDNNHDSTVNQGENNNGENTNQNENKFKEYSKLLQNVLSNEKYDVLINRGSSNQELYKTGAFEPHPYAFLEKEGIDVERIKAGDDEAYTMSYVLDDEPNNLYIYTRVKENNYYITYLLQYKLTEQEMNDYHLLHRGYDQANFYIQAVFMNDEISRTKTPTIVGKSKMLIETFDELNISMSQQDCVESNSCHTAFINPNFNDLTFELKIFPKFNNNFNAMFFGTMANINCKGRFNQTDDVCNSPNDRAGFLVKDQTESNANFFFIQDALLHIGQCQNFEINTPNK